MSDRCFIDDANPINTEEEKMENEEQFKRVNCIQCTSFSGAG
jgi:hypothetical protein